MSEKRIVLDQFRIEIGADIVQEEEIDENGSPVVLIRFFPWTGQPTDRATSAVNTESVPEFTELFLPVLQNEVRLSVYKRITRMWREVWDDSFDLASKKVWEKLDSETEEGWRGLSGKAAYEIVQRIRNQQKAELDEIRNRLEITETRGGDRSPDSGDDEKLKEFAQRVDAICSLWKIIIGHFDNGLYESECLTTLNENPDYKERIKITGKAPERLLRKVFKRKQYFGDGKKMPANLQPLAFALSQAAEEAGLDSDKYETLKGYYYKFRTQPQQYSHKRRQNLDKSRKPRKKNN